MTVSVLALLDLWEERSARSRGADQATLLLGELTDLDPASLDTGPLAERDAAVARAHVDRYGSTVEAVANCPACDELLEVSVDLHATGLLDGPSGGRATVAVGDRVVALEPPSAAMVRAAAGERTPAVALARACATGRSTDGSDPLETLDAAVVADVVERVGEALLRADPRLLVLADLVCAACGHLWASPFDVAPFLLDRLDAEFEDLVADIHVLACSYGWTEADVLALPASRRARYVALCGWSS